MVNLYILEKNKDIDDFLLVFNIVYEYGKEEKMKEKSLGIREKGITLIALVITIIVLLILAGVSIAMLTGENGILTQAKNAKSETEAAAEDEAQKLQQIEDKMNEKIDPSSSKDFVTTWRVNAEDELILPISLSEGDNNFTVDWGDGSPVETVNSEEGALTDYPRHTYGTAGDYDITISGKCSYFCTFILDEALDEESNEEYENPQKQKLIALKSWGEIEARKYEFSGCTKLAGAIPSPSENTFMNFEDNMEYLFLDCESITSIPSDLFSNIPDTIVNFTDTFDGCTSLTSIPGNLFEKAVNAEIFESAFSGCTSLTSIPENLFANNTKVTNFSEVFKECEGLTSIPAGLFANNPEVTNFSYAFYRCKNIEAIPDTIFNNNQKVTDFSFTFYGLDYITTAPALWERQGVTGTSCFGSCDELLDLIDDGSLQLAIPEDWRASES